MPPDPDPLYVEDDVPSWLSPEDELTVDWVRLGVRALVGARIPALSYNQMVRARNAAIDWARGPLMLELTDPADFTRRYAVIDLLMGAIAGFVIGLLAGRLV